MTEEHIREDAVGIPYVAFSHCSRTVLPTMANIVPSPNDDEPNTPCFDASVLTEQVDGVEVAVIPPYPFIYPLIKEKGESELKVAKAGTHGGHMARAMRSCYRGCRGRRGSNWLSFTSFDFDVFAEFL